MTVSVEQASVAAEPLMRWVKPLDRLDVKRVRHSLMSTDDSELMAHHKS